MPVEAAFAGAGDHPEIRTLCSQAIAKHRDAVVAAFLAGSHARGVANDATSDVDVLLVTRPAASRSQLEHLGVAFARLPLPIDAVAVDSAELHSGRFPTAVRFLVKPERGAIWQDRPRADTLLAREDAAGCGVFLGGSDAGFRPKPVSWPLLVRSVAAVFPHIRTRFKNPALSLARVLYAHRTHALCSKAAAGEWGLINMDPRFAEVLGLDLDAYAAGRRPSLAADVLTELERDIKLETAFWRRLA